MSGRSPLDTRRFESRRMVARSVRIGDLMVSEGVISDEQLADALIRQKQSGKLLGRILVESGAITDEQLLEHLSDALGIEKIDLRDEKDIDLEAALKLPEKTARRFHVLVVAKNGNTLTLATANPSDVIAIDNIKSITGMEVKPVLSLREHIDPAIERTYAAAFSLEDMAADMEAEGVDLIREEDSLSADTAAFDEAGEAPVVKYVSSLLYEAVKIKASDIHIETFEREVRIRFRVDGKLREITPPPRRMINAVTSRIKIMSNLDIAERRLPQDGRCKLKISERAVDVRVSTLPCVNGEKVVMRILDQSAVSLDIESLGFDPVTLREVKRILKFPHGVILLCGPTGSGKTTTLYSFVKHIYDPKINIVTVEDPVEYQLAGVNQVPVRSAIGMTFANGLRSILRQDPDVIMIGEMRDRETLEVAVRAALTGHLVFSTIHTNTAVSSITRMVDMGIEPYMVTSTLIAAVSQRLIRAICPKCKIEWKTTDNLRRSLERKFGVAVDFPLYKGEGCAECGNSGYKGRMAVHEYMTMDPTLRQMVIERRTENELSDYCKSRGMRNLHESAFLRLYDGATTVEEAISLFYEDE